jgi:xylulokinase
VPTVLGPLDVAGRWHGIAVAVGTGDNMAASLGLGLAAGDVALSVGTSGTAFAVADAPTADPSGAVAGFADATGRFLPLVCTSNAAKVLDAVARLLGVEHDRFDELALGAVGDTGVPVLLPYFDGERTPNRPDATGLIGGLRSDVTREQFALCAVNGVACGLLDALDALRAVAPVTGRVVLTGGGARSSALRAVLAGLLDEPLVLADVDQAVAAGAAVQAAAVAEGVDHATVQHRWGLGAGAPQWNRSTREICARGTPSSATRRTEIDRGVRPVRHPRSRSRCHSRRHPRRPPAVGESSPSGPGRRRHPHAAINEAADAALLAIWHRPVRGPDVGHRP